MFFLFFFFFSSRRRHTRSLRDWSSDVCSSDLLREQALPQRSGLSVSGSTLRNSSASRLAEIRIPSHRLSRRSPFSRALAAWATVPPPLRQLAISRSLSG